MKLPRLKTIKDVILDVLFPALCLNCESVLEGGDKAKNLCGNCFRAIALYDTLVCPTCGARFAENKKICHKDAPFRLAAAARYDEPIVKKLVHLLKYKSLRAAAAPLGHILNAYLERLPVNFSNYVLVPIPLHKERERLRGFNQAELIAERVAARFKIPIVANAIARIKNNPPQAEMKDAVSRAENMKNCFEIKSPEPVRGKNVLIIDDVFTTGATIGEAVKTLKQAGAKRAVAGVLARAR